MNKALRLILFVTALTAAAVCCPRAGADTGKLDDLLKQLDKTETIGSALTLDDCIQISLQSNPSLQQKLTQLNTVDGDAMIDKSRFFSHVDVVASFTKQNGNMLKTYYPTFNPMPVGSLGVASLGTTSLSGGSSSLSGLSSSDISSLTSGMNMGDIQNLAAQYGVDLSKFGLRQASPSPATAETTPAQRVADKMASDLAAQQRAANLVIQTPIGNVVIDDTQLQNLIASTVTGTSDTTSSSIYTDNHVGIQYSRRLLEWGKDPVSQVGIRENRRLAIFNYQQQVREVVSKLRTTFFMILLKKKQIEERRALLETYEKKLREKQLRYEVAKDVPMIDVLTAELDVLNEKLRINTLRNDLINKKMELLQLMGKPVGMRFDIGGQPPDLKDFEFTLEQIVGLTKKNSYQVTYLEQELQENERSLRDIKRDYRPKYSAKAGFEDRRSDVGFTLNNSDNTYGLDLGAEQHLNLARDSSSSVSSLLSGTHFKNNNYYMTFGVTYNITDNMKSEGVTKKQLENINNMNAKLTEQELAEELQAREAWQSMQEAIEQLALQEDTVNISSRRLEITRKLREFDKVQEYQLDSYRTQYFSDQDRFFTAQENVITAQENLRKIMGVFY